MKLKKEIINLVLHAGREAELKKHSIKETTPIIIYQSYFCIATLRNFPSQIPYLFLILILRQGGNAEKNEAIIPDLQLFYRFYKHTIFLFYQLKAKEDEHEL